MPVLADAARRANSGPDFLHMDVRSDNLCFTGDRVVFVDWNWAVRGPRDLDLACWLAALRLEGGPLPDEVTPGLGAYAAGISGFFAQKAPLPPPEGGRPSDGSNYGSSVSRFRGRAASSVSRNRTSGMRIDELDRIHADLEAGRIDEDEWHSIRSKRR